MSKTVKVLIVVDVQNCFIDGGSLGEAQKDSLVQTKEIFELMTLNDKIYLTRDFHPINHISLRNVSERRYVNLDTIFPNHCRNTDRTCEKRHEEQFEKDQKLLNVETKLHATVYAKHSWTDDSRATTFDTPESINYLAKEKLNEKAKLMQTIDSKIKEPAKYPIIGTNLSYLYFDKSFGTLYKSYQDAIFELIRSGNAIGLKDTFHDTEPKVDNIQYDISGQLVGDKHIYQLTKGEYCDYESYSAFNYHLQFTYNSENNIERTQLVPNLNYSTGLWENIIVQNKLNENSNITLNITVCGLVGNICVMNTVHHGIVTWKNLHQQKYPNVTVNFIYSFPGTRFLPHAPPFSVPLTNYQKLDEINNSTIFSCIIDDYKTLKVGEMLNDKLTLGYKLDNGTLYKINTEGTNVTITTSNNESTEYKIGKDKLVKTEKQAGGSVNYYEKYMKYKNKYLELKNQL